MQVNGFLHYIYIYFFKTVLVAKLKIARIKLMICLFPCVQIASYSKFKHTRYVSKNKFFT